MSKNKTDEWHEKIAEAEFERGTRTGYSRGYDSRNKEITKLKSENEALRDVVEFVSNNPDCDLVSINEALRVLEKFPKRE